MDNNSDAVRQLWQQAAGILKKNFHNATFNHWFKPIVPIRLEDDTLVLGVSDDFFADWLRDNYEDLLDDAVKQAAGKLYRIQFEYGYYPPPEPEEKTTSPLPALASQVTASGDDRKTAEKVLSPEEERNFKDCSKRLLPRYTFDQFVVGEENRYAYAAAMTAAKSPGAYNPLYIYGGTGMGKTHLIQAVAHEVLKCKPDWHVQYVTCEEFLNRYVESLTEKNHSEFRNLFRNVNMLLVDDVHQLANKDRLQEEFFNTFNALYNTNTQIILTSDKQPCEIVGLESRLVSRFESGVTVEITTPSFETRLAILKQKNQSHLVKLDDDVLRFVASRITASIRRLEGALMRLVALSSVMSSRITVERAEDLLHNLLEEENSAKNVSIENIQKTVAAHFDLRVTDLLSNKKPRNIAEPRMVAMYLSRRLTSCSYPEIGEAFAKNHATVMHAEKKVEERCKGDESFRLMVSSIQRQLQS